MIKRVIFPAVNGLVCMVFFAIIGYYVFDPLRWTLAGLALGLIVGIAIEAALGAFGASLYRWRVTPTVIIEIVLIITVAAPFILVYVETVPKPRTVCCLEESGLGEQVENVQIPAADGEMLAGWYAPPAGKPGRVILVLHGSGGDRRGALRHARALHQAGYGVLVYDQRACGESTGERRSIGWYDARDITPVIDWLAARPEVDADHVGGVGLSLGAHILVIAAPNEPRLQAVWADGLGCNAAEDLPAAHSAGDALNNFVNRQAYGFANFYLGENPPPFKQLIPQIAPRHLTLVAGGQDPFEPIINRDFEPYLGDNGSLWVIENAGHVGGLRAIPEEYMRRMVAFFDEALR